MSEPEPRPDDAQTSDGGETPATAQPRVTDAPAPSPIPATDAEASGDEQVRASLKRCSPATVEAALAFRRNRDPKLVPTIVHGIIARFLEPETRERLANADAETRLIDDLGLDSLTIMEIVMLVEEVLGVTVQNEELRHLRSLGDLGVFVDCKVRGVPPPEPARHMPIEQIGAAMPIQPPFLFLQEATVGTEQATGRYKVVGDEFFLQGHFKDRPVLPASIMLEALGQLAVLHLITRFKGDDGRAVAPESILFTGAELVRCLRKCVPGDELRLSVKLRRAREPIAAYEGEITVGTERAAVAEELRLAFAHVPLAPAETSVAAPAAANPTSSAGA